MTFRDEGQLIYPVKVIECINKAESRDKIVKLAQLHDKLTDIMGSINRRFSIQVNELMKHELGLSFVPR